MSIIIPAIVAIVIFLIAMMVAQLASKQETVRERLQRMANDTASVQDATHDATLDPLRTEQELTGFAVFCEQVLRLLGSNPEAFRKNNQLRFYRSGLTSPAAPVYYLFYKRIGFVVILLIAAVVLLQGMHQPKDLFWLRLVDFLMAGMLVICGLFGGDLYLQNLRAKREKVLQRSFPDALDLLLVCVESGLALDGALSRVCKELGRAHPMITQELNRTRLELTLLNDRSQALNNLAERTDMIAFRSLVTTLLQSERFGTSLTDTLRVLSEDYRNSRLMAAEDKAGRLPVLMTIPLITLMMPALFLVILGPAMLKVYHVLHTS